ncbi:MAG TPA: peptide deformylase [Chlamydiales bacterium]|nr:peptide deformylase [Chlamydiales bacterium]
MKLTILYYGHPALRKRAAPIAEITPEIIQLANDMIETVLAVNGIGLAATQVGQFHRMFILREEVLNADGQYSLGAPEVIINPEITPSKGEMEAMLEGCISLPRLHIEVTRPKKIHIRYQNLKGDWIEETLDSFRGRQMMHENDHLNGVLTIDRMDLKERRRIEPYLLAIKKKYNP